MAKAKVLNRRQLLRTAIGATAVPLMCPILATTEPAIAGFPPAPGQALVLVFHGLFAFLFGAKGNDILVVVPSVSGHVYWAGDFGHEDQNPMPPNKPLKLSGIKAGNWTPLFNFPYLNQPLVADSSKSYTTLTIPWPDDLVLDRKVTPISNQDFFSQPAGLKPTELPTIFSFVYRDSTIVSRPGLVGTNWMAPRSWGQPGGVNQAVLHVRAEHCGKPAMNNGWDTFNTLFGLSNTSKIMLNPNYQSSPIGSATGISGLVAPDQDDYLLEEPGCKPTGMATENTPVNCASLGGGKGY
jgi:hypothetical protein